ncbi:long-chain-acyl-CoA synthetase [Temperatibacter marinus]|uniref:Long-chain-acyl-CoA synthetase n=1 Tax=Temperatibacter marinus TaxID=1456591 RepID=A0AA52EG07_9PROT|nr:long-chain-acyl-CoA synthetase [Temperatibacter marinus]WND02998.1 long-chain-acyl-CoA synthetase [Temperatibacter marinus]
MFKKLYSQLKFIRGMSHILKIMKGQEPEATRTLIDDIEASIDRSRDKLAIIDEQGSYTFAEFEARANRYAHWAKQQGWSAGDTVALMMENSIDYPAVWFGLGKVGIITALINSNLEGKGLIHSISIANSKAVITRGRQAISVANIQNSLDSDLTVWDLDGKVGNYLEVALSEVNDVRPDRIHRAHLCGRDTALYIYTSGTTGLPKAARIPHMRLSRSARIPVAMCGLRNTDIVYIVLPLYHITGGALGMGGALLKGATTVIRKQFSASNFWNDLHDHKVTVFFYVGELCRYLVNSDPHELERSHSLRAGVGNGMRGDVWRKFVDRFKVTHMHELYGSTEGNVAFINMDGTIGAVGQMPAWAGKKLGMDFVKFDIEKELPVRDPQGRCIRAEIDEIGEVIGRIEDTGMNKFDGYHEKKATEAKILHDVFTPGDKWFRTGDLMKRDNYGYIYFIDRIGDTYRWKGENVATNEVADVLSDFEAIETANVYGVSVPGNDGRAGMAALTLSGSIDYEDLLAYLQSNLPSYALPIFLRIQDHASMTGNFKFQKVTVQKEGFDISNIKENVMFLCPEEKAYGPLTVDKYRRLITEDYRL